MPTRGERGVLFRTERADCYGYKPSKDLWLEQVKTKGEKCLFQTAYNWEEKAIPEEMSELISERESFQEANSSERWINLMRAAPAQANTEVLA